MTSGFKLAPAALLLASLACSDPGPTATENLPLPATFHSCETNTRELCSTWELHGDLYLASWSQGTEAEIRMVAFSDSVIAFRRRDTAGPTPDMEAFYYGLPVDGTVSHGVVLWNSGGQTYAGRWEGSW